jgi:hypothetical protein
MCRLHLEIDTCNGSLAGDKTSEGVHGGEVEHQRRIQTNKAIWLVVIRDKGVQAQWFQEVTRKATIMFLETSES